MDFGGHNSNSNILPPGVPNSCPPCMQNAFIPSQQPESELIPAPTSKSTADPGAEFPSCGELLKRGGAGRVQTLCSRERGRTKRWTPPAPQDHLPSLVGCPRGQQPSRCSQEERAVGGMAALGPKPFLAGGSVLPIHALLAFHICSVALVFSSFITLRKLFQ